MAISMNGSSGRGKQIAPGDAFPERVANTYERKMAPDAPGGRGTLRFEEGLATDTDLPNEFVNGIMQGYITEGGRSNHNKNVYEKWPDETMRERAHVGSASWVEAPVYLSEFASGTQTPDQYEYLMVNRGSGLGRRYERRNAAEVND